MTNLTRALAGLALLTTALLTACDPPAPPASAGSKPVSVSQVDDRSAGGIKGRQLAFLNRIREADPQHRTIDKALLNERNELGLILDHSVESDKVPQLLKGMLVQMAKEFPGQDLTVLAYTPSNPPHKIGTARLDARTRNMSYTPE